MFETAELGRTIPSGVYKKSARVLREELLHLQDQVRKLAQGQVILVFAGVDGAGKSQTVSLLNEWMDPRWLITRALDDPSDYEREHPPYWRYWLSLPPRGRIGMYLSSWYSEPILDRVYGAIDEAEFDRRLDRILAFEQALTDDNALIIKFWMHLSRDAQRDRLKSLEADLLERARVTDRDWRHWKLYDAFKAAAERVIMRTSTGKAPWHIIEGVDQAYRSLTVGTLLRDGLKRQIDRIELDRRLESELGHPDAPDSKETKKQKKKKQGEAAEQARAEGQSVGSSVATVIGEDSKGRRPLTVLSQLDMGLKLQKSDYSERLRILQAKLNGLHREARARRISTILVFEGPDAGGKGGAIRRIAAALDARNYQVHGFSSPTDEERAQHYLWRFWRHLPRAGRISMFDRSWYGRVLVERVEGFASEDEWRRAYAEINDFEAQLVEHGMILVKYWIHISKKEQLDRFRLRERTPYKRWKLSDEDWRNRDKWDNYELAVNDMVQYTSTQLAPWTLVEGDDKRFARIKCLDTLCERLGEAVNAAKLKDNRRSTEALST